MTRLCDLSEDVLRLILDGDTSINAVALWMTFDRQMRSRLANRGITDLILPTLYIPRDVSWPGYLRFWKLRSLRILDFEWDTPHPVGPQLRASLRQLWNGLEVLSIRGYNNVTTAFELDSSPSQFDETSSPSHALYAPAKRSKVSESAVPQHVEDTSSSWNMNITHPNLKTLNINGNKLADSFAEHRLLTSLTDTLGPLENVFGAQRQRLPSSAAAIDDSLVALVLAKRRLARNAQNPTLLPAINFHNIDCLPHSLTHVAAKTYPASCYTEEALLELARPGRKCLPNLASFPLIVNIEVLYHIHRNYGWPANMDNIELKWSPREQEWDQHSHLIPCESHLWPADWSKTFNGVIGQLPNTLTRLSADRIDWQFVESSKSLWPSTLTSMDIDTGNAQPYFSLLPRTLRVLTFDAKDGSGRSHSDLLLLGRDCLTNIDGDKWSAIKQQLLSYPGIDIDTQRRMEIEEYISLVEDGALYGLPLTIEKLTCGPHIDSLTTSLLPPLVTRAKLCGCEMSNPKQSPLRAIPPYLTALKLRYHSQLGPESDWQQLSSTHSSTGPRALLNSNITSLKLSNDIEPRLAQHLPRGLLQLSITMPCSTLNTSFLTHLTSLKSLKVQGLNGTIPKTSWASKLPRSLTHVDIDVPLEGSYYKDLPPSLESLCVNPPTHTRFTVAEIDARPSTLYKGKLTRRSEPADEDHLESWPQIRKQLIDFKHSQSRRK